MIILNRHANLVQNIQSPAAEEPQAVVALIRRYITAITVIQGAHNPAKNGDLAGQSERASEVETIFVLRFL